MSARLDLDAVRFDPGTGTVVVVAQDAGSGRVLMVANADREALERTIETGDMHYRSRTRGLWRKGETSGNVQRAISLTLDCDGDTVLARVIAAGPACHTGAESCFEGAGDPTIWSALAEKISMRHAQMSDEPGKVEGSVSSEPGAVGSYTARLLLDRNLRLKKIGEESAEVIAACADGDSLLAGEEGADLVYHLAVALEGVGSSLDAVARILLERAFAGGVTEKQS